MRHANGCHWGRFVRTIVEVEADTETGIVKVVRALAVTDRERSKFLPEVPTTPELGYPTVISSSTRGVMGPRGLPAPVIKKVQEVFLEAMKSPEHMEKMDIAAMTHIRV